VQLVSRYCHGGACELLALSPAFVLSCPLNLGAKRDKFAKNLRRQTFSAINHPEFKETAETAFTFG